MATVVHRVAPAVVPTAAWDLRSATVPVPCAENGRPGVQTADEGPLLRWAWGFHLQRKI